MRKVIQTTGVTKPNSRRDSERFPLYRHKSGNYAKKVRGRVIYFGKDRQAAFLKWIEQRDDLLAGRIARPKQETVDITLSAACDALLCQKQSLVESGELSLRTLKDYRLTVKRLIDHFGPQRFLTDLRPVDFMPFRAACAVNHSAVTTGNILRYVRAIFRFAYDQDLIDRPIKFGKALALPSQATVRAERNERGPLMFSSNEIRQMLDGMKRTAETGEAAHLSGSSPVLRAMILLAINCGFGQTDCSRLTFRHIDLESGWHTFPRPKTSEKRRCPLWPETVAAIREYLKIRVTPRDSQLSDRVFLTYSGLEFVRVKQTDVDGESRITPIDVVGRVFVKLLKKLNMKRFGVSFYSLRRTFRTIADEVNDQPAISLVMGHSAKADDMAARYRQSISDERLKVVSDYVRNWLFGTC